MQYPTKGYMIVYNVDGTQENVRLEPMNLRLNQFQEILGGYFQIVYHRDNICLLVDEDGHNKNLPENQKLLGFVGKVCVVNIEDM